MAGDGVAIQIEALSAENAAALFIRLAGGSRGSVDERTARQLGQLCGNLPLALALLAAQLRHHPTRTVADLELQLLTARNPPGRLGSEYREVAAAFELSYQDLPPDARRSFRQLSVFPGMDFDIYSAAAVVNATSERARRIIDLLYGDHLLEEREPYRYQMHDLVRDYGRTLAEDDESMDNDAIIARLGDYYLAVLADANVFLDRGSRTPPEAPRAEGKPALADRTAALRWLERERANLLACIDQASDQGQRRLVVRLAAAAAPFLRHAGPWDHARRLHATSAVAARMLDDRRAEAAALLNQGVISRLMGAYPDAIRALTAAAEICRTLGDSLGESDALNPLGIVWYLTGDYQTAEDTQTAALDAARHAGDLLAQANALADLGMVRRQIS